MEQQGAPTSSELRRRRRGLLRAIGLRGAVVKAHQTVGSFRTLLAELGYRLDDIPAELVAVRTGGRPRRDCRQTLQRRANYATLRALGASSREATETAKCGSAATRRLAAVLSQAPSARSGSSAIRS